MPRGNAPDQLVAATYYAFMDALSGLLQEEYPGFFRLRSVNPYAPNILALRDRICRATAAPPPADPEARRHLLQLMALVEERRGWRSDATAGGWSRALVAACCCAVLAASAALARFLASPSTEAWVDHLVSRLT